VRLPFSPGVQASPSDSTTTEAAAGVDARTHWTPFSRHSAQPASTSSTLRPEAGSTQTATR
jgi:hypothetical protein